MRADDLGGSVKRGVVVGRDPANARLRVQFLDEDEIVSHWVDVLARSSGAVRTYIMPQIGDEVWCAMDMRGEDGCMIGVKYNDTRRPPHRSNDEIGLKWPGGAVYLNTATNAVDLRTAGDVTLAAGGAVDIRSGGAVTIAASEVVIKADAVAINSATLTHNGTDISEKHAHKDVAPGKAKPGPPV